MALTEQTVHVRFAGGVDTKSDPKTVPPTKLLVAENVVFTRAGSLAKRPGYDLLGREVDGAVDAYEDPRALAARGDELLLFAGGRMLSRRPSSSTWSDVGPISSLTSTERPVGKTGTHQTDPAAWTADGVTVAAWEDSRGGVWWTVLEEGTDRVLRRAEQLDDAGTAPRVAAVGGRFHVYWARASLGEIRVAVANPSDLLSPVTPSVLVSGVHVANPGYDVAVTGRVGAPAVMTWPTAEGDLRIAYVDGAGELGGPGTGHPTAITVPGAAPDGGPVGINWNDERLDGQPLVATLSTSGADARFRICLDDDLDSVVIDDMIADVADTTAVRCTIALTRPPQDYQFVAWISVESSAARPQDARTTHTRVRLAADLEVDPVTLDGVTRALRGHGLASRLFVVGDAAFVVLAHEVPFYPYCPVVRLDDSLRISTAGRLLTGVGDGLRVRGVLPAVTPSADPSTRLWAGVYREQLLADPTGLQFTETGLRQCVLDFDDEDALQSAQLGADLVVAGSVAQRYDGDTIAELGFHTAPDGEIDAVPVAGGSLTAGTRAWKFCYEEVDAAGEIHQGPMSIPQVIELEPGEPSVTFQIPTYRLTSKRRVRIAVWRTEVNDDSADPRFYRVTSLSPSATGIINGYLLNRTDVDYVAFTDGLSDEDLILREPAYDNQGVLSNDPAPLGALVAGGKNRLFFSSAEDENTVVYTQQRRAGYGPETSTDLRIVLDPDGGAVTAIAVLDDAVVAFKRGQTYVFAGDGPSPNPDATPQLGFSPPQLVTSDVGCTSPQSIAVTPIGVIFKSARGYHLIDRSRQVRYVGAPVEQYNDLTVAAAVTLPDRTSILILHTNGVALHYDYFVGEWSWFTNHEALDAVVAGDQYYFLRADAGGRVARENRASYLDGTREIVFRIETAWIRFLPYVQGWQKLWHLLIVGEYLTPHRLQVSIATDYRPGWDAPYTLTPDENYSPSPYGAGAYGDGPYGGDPDQLYQERIHVSEQCMAVRVRIQDAPSGEAPLGGSVLLTELTFTGGAVRATDRPRASRSH
jgi:hypothetical protein